MREIKFRYWCSQRKKMFIESMDSYYVGDYFGDERFTPLQYTGLKDKNSKRIYEGDILSVQNHTDIDLNKISFITQVVFEDGCFSIGDDFLFEVTDVAEVIGNIYENPELLKGEKK